MLKGCEKLWKLLIEKNMKNSLFMNKSTKPMMIQGLCVSLWHTCDLQKCKENA